MFMVSWMYGIWKMEILQTKDGTTEDRRLKIRTTTEWNGMDYRKVDEWTNATLNMERIWTLFSGILFIARDKISNETYCTPMVPCLTKLLQRMRLYNSYIFPLIGRSKLFFWNSSQAAIRMWPRQAIVCPCPSASRLVLMRLCFPLQNDRWRYQGKRILLLN